MIDCTGGWWAEEEWRGVLLADLGLPGSALDVVSATGYRRRLPGPDGVLLATHAAGAPARGPARRPRAARRAGAAGVLVGQVGGRDRADRRALVVAAAATPPMTAT